MKALTKGRTACVVLAATVAGFGVASTAGAASTPKASLPAGAAVIYSDLGPGNAYDCCAGWTITEPGAGGHSYAAAMSFTPSSNAYVMQIDLAVQWVAGANNSTVQLTRDAGGIPGTVLATWSISGLTHFPNCCPLTRIRTSLIPVAAGQTYWVLAKAGPNGSDDTADAWNWNSTGATGGDFYADGTWYSYGNPTGAFDVIGCTKLCKAS